MGILGLRLILVWAQIPVISIFFLGFAIYWAIKQSIAQQKELDRRIEQHERQFPDKSEQYVWKS